MVEIISTLVYGPHDGNGVYTLLLQSICQFMHYGEDHHINYGNLHFQRFYLSFPKKHKMAQ